MAIRFDDAELSITLSVHDLADAGGLSGHLSRAEGGRSGAARMAAGRRVHTGWQAARAQEDGGFSSEVRLEREVRVGRWTVRVHGRVDGLSELAGHPLVEEVKSTALGSFRLERTRLEDWPHYRDQLEIYLWMLAGRGQVPVGRLVLVSLADASRTAFGVAWEPERVEADLLQRLQWIVAGRDRLLAWLAERRDRVVPMPFPTWRPGQELISAEVERALGGDTQLLVQAPTGLGKTAAVLHGALSHALPADRQVFWATSRTTQQPGLERTAQLFRDAGLRLRSASLNARERMCLQEVVDCSPEACPYARDYHDKVREHALAAALEAEALDAPGLRELGRAHQVCPYELSRDVAAECDVVVGDYNYAFDPDARNRQLFGEDSAHHWVVVVDEAHQLPDRAMGYGSPQVHRAAAEAVLSTLEGSSGSWRPFVRAAAEVRDEILDARLQIVEQPRDHKAVASLSLARWRDLADRLDELSVDHAVLTAARPLVPPGDEDPWTLLSRQVQRFRRQLDLAGDETVHLVDATPGQEQVSLLCCDPSPWLGPILGGLGGVVAMSATLSPLDFYRDLLGLARHDVLRVSSPFPQAHRKVLLAPRISTVYRDRVDQAPGTAQLLESCLAAVPGNAAVYFSSFAMLRDISARWSLEGREVLVQEPGMTEVRRRAWLERMGQPGPPVVLAAVLGGIFAEGIDLPEGALRAVFVLGPALPPVGLERDLLRDYYQTQYGAGFQYASLVPGMTKVIQAAGRLIRRPEDRGTVVLLGKRFRWRDYRTLLPEDWSPEIPDDPAEAITGFWAED